MPNAMAVSTRSRARLTKENGFFSGGAMAQKEGAAAGLSNRNWPGGPGAEISAFTIPRGRLGMGRPHRDLLTMPSGRLRFVLILALLASNLLVGVMSLL